MYLLVHFVPLNREFKKKSHFLLSLLSKRNHHPEFQSYTSYPSLNNNIVLFCTFQYFSYPWRSTFVSLIISKNPTFSYPFSASGNIVQKFTIMLPIDHLTIMLYYFVHFSTFRTLEQGFFPEFILFHTFAATVAIVNN